MNCRYCNESFRLTKLHVEPNVCLECSGVVDDLNIDDEEIKIDIANIKNPTGRTKPVFDDELET